MLRSVSIAKRILSLIALSGVLAMAVVVLLDHAIYQMEVVGVQEVEQTMLAGHKEKLQVATHSIAVSLGQAVQGLSPDEQLAIVKQQTGGVRFEEDKSGYFFTYRNTTALSVPAKPSVEGKDLGAAQDKNGVRFVQRLYESAQKGGGFLTWTFSKPGAGEALKLGYAEMIPGTDMWIGTGVYIDNVQAQKAAVAVKLNGVAGRAEALAVGILAGLFVLLSLLGLAIVRSVTKPLKETTRAAEVMARGDLDLRCDVQGHGRGGPGASGPEHTGG